MCLHSSQAIGGTTPSTRAVRSVNTDSDGRYSLTLPPWRYYIVVGCIESLTYFSQAEIRATVMTVAPKHDPRKREFFGIASGQRGDPEPIPVRTLNHVRLMVPSIQRTLEWYLKLTDMKTVEILCRRPRRC